MPTLIDVTSQAPLVSAYVTIGADATLPNERALTGTSNQIVVTDNGAGSTVVLSTPQNLHTAATPTFASLTLTGLTAGRVPIITTSGLLADDGTLLWDNTLKRLGVGAIFRTPDECIFSVSKDYLTQTANNMTEQVRSAVRSVGSGAVQAGRLAFSAWAEDATGVVLKTITGAANNGSGLIRITATTHTFATGDRIGIYNVGGTIEANGSWTITVIDANTFDLQSSTFLNTYTSGGTATNASQMVGYRSVVMPQVARNIDTGASVGLDVNGYTVSNAGTAAATDAFWVTDELVGSTAWRTLFSSDSRSDYFLRFTGTANTIGIDVSTSTQTGPAIKLGQAHQIVLGTTAPSTIATKTITTDVDSTVSAATFGSTFTKNDANVRYFPVVKIAPTVNFGASNDNTRLALLEVGNATMTNTTGLSDIWGLRVVANWTMATAPFTVDRYSSDTTGAGYAQRKARGGVGTESAVLSGDVVGSIAWQSYDAATSGQLFPTTVNAQIRVSATENQDTTHHGAKLELRTTAIASTTLTTRVTIDENGISSAAKIFPATDDGAALGDTTHNFSDLFLASGAVVNWNNGDVTLTHATNNLLFAGASSGYTFDAKVYPTSNDGAALGDTTHQFSDLFLAEGGVINWDNGDATLTQTGDDITIAGITTFSVGTGTTVTLGSIELGAASDTTMARVSAGVVSIEGVKIPTIVKQTNTSTSTSLTITSAQYGSTLLWSPGGTATATLPANGAAVGSWFDIILLTNQTVTISAATADTLITDGDINADSVAFSTVSHKIGSAVRFVSDGTSWIAINIGSTTMTIAT